WRGPAPSRSTTRPCPSRSGLRSLAPRKQCAKTRTSPPASTSLAARSATKRSPRRSTSCTSPSPLRLMSFGKAAAAIALTLAAPVFAAPFDPAPWLADLDQARQAFSEKYANWDWVENEREVKIEPLFDDLGHRM